LSYAPAANGGVGDKLRLYHPVSVRPLQGARRRRAFRTLSLL